MKSELPTAPRTARNVFDHAQLVLSLTVVLISVTALIGWHAGISGFSAVFPSFAPMTFNTSLGFLLCGLALTLNPLKRRISCLFTVLLLFVAVASLIQYPLGLDFGIDELLVKAATESNAFFPGRMAPATSLCFLLIAAGLILARNSKVGSFSLLTTGLTGAVVTALGLVALVGYVSGFPFKYGWGQFTSVALQTAFGLIFAGLAMIALAWGEGVRRNLSAPYWLPALVTVSSLTITLALWQALYVHEKAGIELAVEQEANNIKQQVELEINSRILTIEQMANRWTNHEHGTPYEEWKADADRFIRDYAAYQAVEWADPDFVIRWVTPAAGNEAAVGLNLKTYTDRRRAIEFAKANRVTVLTRKHTLSQGGNGIIIYSPIFRDDKFQGFIIGVFRTDELFRSIIPAAFFNGYGLDVKDGDETIFTHGEPASQTQDQLAQFRQIKTHTAEWRAKIYPNEKTIADLHTANDEIVLMIGLTMSVLLIIAVYFTQESRRRNQESVVINNDLRHEILERQRASEELRASEQHNRDIIEKSLGYICTHRLDGTLISINPAAANSLGYSPQEMQGKRIAEFMPRSARRFFDGYLVQIANKGELSGLFNVVCRNGERRLWEFNNTLYQTPGTEPHILAHAVDVTDRHRIETELTNARNVALESARVKAEFLANMSHEIRTPMNGILGMTDLLADTPMTKTQRQYLETIKASGESLLEIINDILDFSKLEAGKLRFDKIDFDLRSTIENTVEIFANQAAAKHIELASLVHSDVEVALCGDPGRLRQVLTNLIGNAIKFTAKGEIVIRVEKEKESKRQVVLKFSVRDTGIGIDPDAQETLFLAFSQADGSITRKFGGTGLGLTISKQLVEMMNGSLSVESVPGEGSTFIFTAAFEKQPFTENRRIKQNAALDGLKVLIVDDNSTNREILRHQLESKGVAVNEASCGTEAIEKAADAARSGNPFDLAILDLIMPDITGFKLARELRAIESLQSLRLILMPSFGRRGHGRIAKQINIDGYLTKPIKQTDLFDCITAITNGEKVRIDDRRRKNKKLITRHSLTEQRTKNKGLILLVEDNAVNQKLIKIQLSRLGYQADVAGNGFEALAALEKRSYDLILMDCQMPELDGYAATERIRENETPETRLPIIAITANVLPEEVEKCFSSGMDNCLAKPFTQQQLGSEIERWMNRPDESLLDVHDSVDPEEKQIARGDQFDSIKCRMDELAAEIGFEVVDEIITLFIEDSAIRLQALGAAVSDKDLSRIRVEAHGMKGSCGNVGAAAISELSFAIETASQKGDFREAAELFSSLERSFPDLIATLEKIQRSFVPADELVEA